MEATYPQFTDHSLVRLYERKFSKEFVRLVLMCGSAEQQPNGKWRYSLSIQNLSEEELKAIPSHIKDMLKRLRYIVVAKGFVIVTIVGRQIRKHKKRKGKRA